jgi:hypothetical protein
MHRHHTNKKEVNRFVQVLRSCRISIYRTTKCRNPKCRHFELSLPDLTRGELWGLSGGGQMKSIFWVIFLTLWCSTDWNWTSNHVTFVHSTNTICRYIHMYYIQAKKTWVNKRQLVSRVVSKWVATRIKYKAGSMRIQSQRKRWQRKKMVWKYRFGFWAFSMASRMGFELLRLQWGEKLRLAFKKSTGLSQPTLLENRLTTQPVFLVKLWRSLGDIGPFSTKNISKISTQCSPTG